MVWSSDDFVPVAGGGVHPSWHVKFRFHGQGTPCTRTWDTLCFNPRRDCVAPSIAGPLAGLQNNRGVTNTADGSTLQAAFWEGTQYWTSGDTAALRAVCVLGFLLGTAYICFAAVLACCQRVMVSQMLSPAFVERTTHILSESPGHRV